MRKSPKTWAQRLHSLYRLHRWIGITAALFVLWLAISGLALNHSPDLKLGQRHVTSPSVLQRYGVSVTSADTGYQVGLDWVAEADGVLMINTHPVAEITSAPVGAAQVGMFWFVAGKHWLILADPEGQVIEQVSRSALPHAIEGITYDAEFLRIQGEGRQSRSNLDLDGWQPDSMPFDAVTAKPLPDELRQRLENQARARHVTWERLLLDLHTGRYFGPLGVIIIDIAAILMTLLALSGLLLWLRYMNRQRQLKKRRKTQ